MGKKQYLAEKKKKKKSAMGGVFIVLIIGAVFVYIVAKFAFTGTVEDTFSGPPTQDDVYEIAKQYVKPTLKSEGSFSDSQYEYGKKDDSVYIIKSHVDLNDNQRMNFEITLKFKGGVKTDQRNWDVLNLNED